MPDIQREVEIKYLYMNIETLGDLCLVYVYDLSERDRRNRMEIYLNPDCNLFKGFRWNSTEHCNSKLQEWDVLFPVKIWRNLFMPLSPAGWIIVMVSSPSFQRRPLDSCSSSRTLLPWFWLEPDNQSTSHQSSGPYTGFQLHLGLILKYFTRL